MLKQESELTLFMFLKTEIFYATSEHNMIFLYHSLQKILVSVHLLISNNILEYNPSESKIPNRTKRFKTKIPKLGTKLVMSETLATFHLSS